MNGKKLSIIIPVYNVEKYLPQCLHSVVELPIDSYEVVLVNDGSTDRSGEIVREYAHRYPDLIVATEQPNQGLSAARNTGLDLAQGEYVLFLDSDDYVIAEELDAFWRSAWADGADVAVAQYAKDVEGEIQAHAVSRGKRRLAGRDAVSGTEYMCRAFDPFTDEIDVEVCTQLYRRAFLQEYSVRFCPGLLHEDTLFSFQVYLAAETVRVYPSVFYRYRMRRNSIMHSLDKRHYQSVWTIACRLKEEAPSGLRPVESTIVELAYEAMKTDEVDIDGKAVCALIDDLRYLTLRARIKRMLLLCRTGRRCGQEERL